MAGATTLRQLLRSLCHCTQWKYAVFWKLKYRSRMLLAWEDAYCNYPKPKDTMHHLPENVCFKDMLGIISFGSQMDENNLTSTACSVGLAVANMSCLLYALGEGVVGKVAFTGRHSWIFASEFSPKFVSEYPEEWQLQFAAGIKTILLVPVLDGVVQLGSSEMVMEDLTLVSHIKDLFNSLQNALGESSPLISAGGLQVPLPFPSPLFGDSSMPSAMISSLINQSQTVLLKNNGSVVPDAGPTPTSRMLTISPNYSQLIMVEENPQSAQKSMQCLLETESKGRGHDTSGALFVNSSVVSHCLPNQLANANHLGVYGNETCTDFSFEDGSQVQPQFSAVNQLMSSEQSSMSSSHEKDTKELQKSSQVMIVNSVDAYDFHFLEHMVDWPFGSMTSDEMLGGGFINFPADSELHEALGPAFHKGYRACHWDPAVSREDGFGGSSLFCPSDFTEGSEPSAGESDGLFWRGNGDEEHLLDAVVTGVYGASNRASKRASNIRSPSSSSGQLAVSCQTRSRSEGGALAGEDSGPWNFTKSAFAPRGDCFAVSPTGSSSKATSVLIDNGPQKLETGSVQSKKGLKLHQVSKKKAGAGDIQRPRPRDRQLIQDRVKELRELVPNSEKCSIDSLLERTIKHMLFLQCVTKQAEKLKQCKYPEVAGNDSQNSYLPSQMQQTDGTWAFDLGSQSGLCPIVVENLDQPGRMLVEMLCEEHGLFLEIAQVIRHLELTILKGVMENRSNKIWAHFIVEASRGFQRMDILWPLMQLLQRNSNPTIQSKF